MIQHIRSFLISRAWRLGLVSRVCVLVGRTWGGGARRRLLVFLRLIPASSVQLLDAIEAHSRGAAKLRDVERVPLLAEPEFIARYGRLGVPVVIKEPIQSTALRWSFEYLKRTYGHVEVYVRKGTDYDRLARKRVLLGEYIDSLVGGGNEFYAANNTLPEPMRAELSLPPYYRAKLCFDRAQLWIGGTGTGAHLHRDLVDNFLCQLIGTKEIYLCAPDESERLYTWEVHRGLNSSKVDLRNQYDDRYPLARLAKILRVTLKPGETLYIPCGWFHQVANLGNSCSVNFFGRFPSVAALPELESQLLAHEPTPSG